MEIYFPASHNPASQKVPVILMFHGGGWAGGDLKQFRYLCRYLASRGLVAITVNYQLMPAGEDEKAFCIPDAKSAIRWVKLHSDELGIDPNRVIVGGGSAGGHVAFVATLTPGLNAPPDPKDVDTSVVAYVLFNPAFSAQDKTHEIDAVQLVEPGLAPMIVSYGTQEIGRYWFKGWQAVQRKMKEVGCEDVEVWMAQGQPHGFSIISRGRIPLLVRWTVS